MHITGKAESCKTWRLKLRKINNSDIRVLVYLQRKDVFVEAVGAEPVAAVTEEVELST